MRNEKRGKRKAPNLFLIFSIKTKREKGTRDLAEVVRKLGEVHS
jgi:hypothetical protein